MKVNRIIKYLILADLAFWTGWGLVTPVFPIFVVENIIGGSALVAGIASAVYWITKSTLQYPAGLFLDHHKGDRDDYFFLVMGFLIASAIPLGYLTARFPWQIYAFDFFYGIGMAMSIAGWRAIFTRNIDDGREATEWSMDDAVLGFGTGVSCFVTGFLVVKFGFVPSFVFASMLGIISVIFLLCLRTDIIGNYRGGIYADLRDVFNSSFKKNKP